MTTNQYKSITRHRERCERAKSRQQGQKKENMSTHSAADSNPLSQQILLPIVFRIDSHGMRRCDHVSYYARRKQRSHWHKDEGVGESETVINLCKDGQLRVSIADSFPSHSKRNLLDGALGND